MKCLDCWREVDRNERGKGKTERCNDCRIKHRKHYLMTTRKQKYRYAKLQNYYSNLLNVLKQTIK